MVDIPPRSALDVYRENRALFSPVMSDAFDEVCRLCFGAFNGEWPQCYDCYELFNRSSCPNALARTVVPMSLVLNPSPWYGVLSTYKTARPEHYQIIGALALLWISEHEEKLAAICEGAIDLITIVPSKRRGIGFDRQPLQRALALSAPIRRRLRHTLSYVEGSHYGRLQYTPRAFAPGPVSVEGKNVLLIEDTWITGATAVSAAGALLQHGARAVVVTPIAREVKLSFHGSGHPVVQFAKTVKHSLTAWPREDDS